MSPFEMIKSHLSAAVPFANTVGVTLLEISNAAKGTPTPPGAAAAPGNTENEEMDDRDRTLLRQASFFFFFFFLPPLSFY